MTIQIGEFFEYQAEEYCVMGWTGGKLPFAHDFGMSFSAGSTASWKGHSMIYGIRANDMLVVKRIIVTGKERDPITHNYELLETPTRSYYYLDHVIPLTGYILFGHQWDFYHVYGDAMPPAGEMLLFEAAINMGHVTGVTEISQQVFKNTQGRDRSELHFMTGNDISPAHKLEKLEQVWNITGKILPRRYDVLYLRNYYLNFKEWADELKAKISEIQS